MLGRGTTLNGAPVHARGAASLAEAMLYATTPHMFKAGFETRAFGAVRGASLKRTKFISAHLSQNVNEF